MCGGGRIALGLPLLVLLVACEAASPRGTLLVTSGFTDQIFTLDPFQGEVLDSLSLDRRPGERDEPHGVAASSDGRHWYATLSHGEPSLWKYEAAGHRLVGRLTLPTTGASRVRLSPDGSLAAVPDYWLAGGGAVSGLTLVRTEDLSVVASTDVCPAPHDAAFSPSGDRIAVTCALGTDLVILDGTSLQPLHTWPLSPDGAGSPPLRPMNATWTPDGGRVLVSLMGRGVVVDVDASTGESRDIGVGERPAQLELSPDGRWLVVANRGGASASVVTYPGGEATEVSLPGAHPHGVTWGPSSATAYLTYEGEVGTPGGVVAIDVAEGRVMWHTSVGVFTLGIAYLPAARD